MELSARVSAALETSVVPTVVARGGALRLVSLTDGVVTLEMSGSPGAALPLASRIESLIRAAVPEIIRVRIVAPHRPSSIDNPQANLAAQVQSVLDTEINPVIAAHHGHVAVAEVTNGTVRIRLEGGCQGCSLAEVTIRQGIEPLLRARLPSVVEIIDMTDHESGTAPFFSPEKR